MAFFTEKQTEAFLKLENQNITMPNGSIRSFTQSALIWICFDRLIKFSGQYSEKKIAELTVINAKEVGITIEESFHDVVAYIYQHYEKICYANMDKRIAKIETVLKNLKGKTKTNFNKIA